MQRLLIFLNEKGSAAQKPKEQKVKRKLEDDVFFYVMQDIVSHLMAHYEEELIWRQFCDDRVPKHNTFRLSEPSDIRIYHAGILALIHLKDPSPANTCTIGK